MGQLEPGSLLLQEGPGKISAVKHAQVLQVRALSQPLPLSPLTASLAVSLALPQAAPKPSSQFLQGF